VGKLITGPNVAVQHLVRFPILTPHFFGFPITQYPHSSLEMT
jgi:hypothetical protein